MDLKVLIGFFVNEFFNEILFSGFLWLNFFFIVFLDLIFDGVEWILFIFFELFWLFVECLLWIFIRFCSCNELEFILLFKIKFGIRLRSFFFCVYWVYCLNFEWIFIFFLVCKFCIRWFNFLRVLWGSFVLVGLGLMYKFFLKELELVNKFIVENIWWYF